MKVGTDGVLLGAWVRLLGTERHILDVGTGTGVIALMLAQRTAGPCEGAGGILRSEPFSARGAKCQSTVERPSVTIIGIDLDGASAEEAAANFKASPWAGRMAAFPGDFRGLGGDPSHPLAFLAIGYDLIVSNPPFFLDSLKAPDPRRSDARHADSLRYRDLVVGADRNLAPDGRLALSARPPYHLMLKDPALQEKDMLPEALKVMRKLNARMEKLNEEQAAAADGGVQ